MRRKKSRPARRSFLTRRPFPKRTSRRESQSCLRKRAFAGRPKQPRLIASSRRRFFIELDTVLEQRNEGEEPSSARVEPAGPSPAPPAVAEAASDAAEPSV